MVTTKFILDRRAAKPGGPAALKVMIQCMRKTALVNLNLPLLPEQWDDRAGRVIKHPQMMYFNSVIGQRKAEIDAFIYHTLDALRLTDMDPQLLKDSYLNAGALPVDMHRLPAKKIIRAVSAARISPTPPRRREIKTKKGNFISVFTEFAGTKKTDGTRSVYAQTLRKLRAYSPDIDRLTFEDINFKWLSDFEAFCAETASKNARNIHLRNIRAVFNHAIDNEITTAYPFRRYKIQYEATRKRSLPVDELRKLFDYPVEPYAEYYLDMFKLMFYLIGINATDLYNLDRITPGGRIEYKRAKTHRLYSLKVEPEAMEIIERHRGRKKLLDLADRWACPQDFLKHMNKALKSIGAEKNKGGRLKGGAPKRTDKSNKPQGLWPELSSYWSRHSWATIARRIKVSKDDIALALGHSDGHDTTNIYIDEDPEAVDIANRRVIDWVLYNKQ